MKKFLLGCLVSLAIVVVVSIFIVGAWLLISKRGNEGLKGVDKRQPIRSSTPTRSQAKQQEILSAQAVTVVAPALVQAYRDNEVAADADYRGKVVSIEGKVIRIAEGILGKSTYVTISGGQGFRNVHCSMNEAEMNNELLKMTRAGDRIAVKGVVDGLIGDVQVRECVILATVRP